MKKIIYLIPICLLISGTILAQEEYPKFYQAGTKIELVPDVNVYLISESQFDKSLTISELYKNSEKRIELLKLKVAQQDSMIKLGEAKAVNFDSTLTHTKQKLDQCTDESQSCQKELARQTSCKKKLIGLAGLEAVILLLVIAL